MADTRVAMPITFSTDCKTPADLACRYRVLAAMSDGGVTFRQSRESLLALASMCDAVAQGPWVIVHEVEKPLAPSRQLLWVWCAGLLVVALEDALRGFVTLWGAI
jgi:hypothetical protein